MNPTLKSLLITTVLTIPTMFGSGLSEEVQEHTREMSIVELVTKTGELERLGRPKAAARIFAGTVYRSDVLWFNILFATKMIENLGYPQIAIDVYEHSKQQQNTTTYKSKADAEIQRLKQIPSSRLQSSLDTRLCNDVWSHLTGFLDRDELHGDKLHTGWLSLQDLANISLVSTEWHEFAQPMVDAANQWRHTVVSNVLSGTTSDLDRRMLQLFGHNPNTTRFNLLLSVVLDKRISYSKDKVKDIVSRDTGILASEKKILLNVLTDAASPTPKRLEAVVSMVMQKYP